MISRSFFLAAILLSLFCSCAYAEQNFSDRYIQKGTPCVAAENLPDNLARKLVNYETKNLYDNWLKPADFESFRPCAIEFYFLQNGLVTESKLNQFRATGSVAGDFSCFYAVLTSMPVEVPDVSDSIRPTGLEFTFDEKKGQISHFSKKLLAHHEMLICPLIPPMAIKKYGSIGLNNQADENCLLISKSLWKKKPEQIKNILMTWQNFYKEHPTTATNSELQGMASTVRTKLARLSMTHRSAL